MLTPSSLSAPPSSGVPPPPCSRLPLDSTCSLPGSRTPTEFWAMHHKYSTATRLPKPGTWRQRCIVRYPLMRNIIYFCFANKIINTIFFFQSALMYVNRPSYLQHRRRDTDVENKHLDTNGEGAGVDELGGWIDMYILLILCCQLVSCV